MYIYSIFQNEKKQSRIHISRLCQIMCSLLFRHFLFTSVSCPFGNNQDEMLMRNTSPCCVVYISFCYIVWLEYPRLRRAEEGKQSPAYSNLFWLLHENEMKEGGYTMNKEVGTTTILKDVFSPSFSF